jgi:hypothetical protein
MARPEVPPSFTEALAARLGTGEEFYRQLQKVSKIAAKYGYDLERLWVIAGHYDHRFLNDNICVHCHAHREFLVKVGWE